MGFWGFGVLGFWGQRVMSIMVRDTGAGVTAMAHTCTASMELF